MNENSSRSSLLKVSVILIFVLCLIIMHAIEPGFKAYSGGAGMPEMQFGYNAVDIYQLLRKLGAQGISLYIKQLCVDFVFIASFALIQNYLMKWVLGKALLNTGWRILLSIAYLRALFDVCENILLLILLFNYPSELGKLAAVSGYITIIKFLLLGLWIIALPAAFIARKLWRRTVAGSQTGTVEFIPKGRKIE